MPTVNHDSIIKGTLAEKVYDTGDLSGLEAIAIPDLELTITPRSRDDNGDGFNARNYELIVFDVRAYGDRVAGSWTLPGLQGMLLYHLASKGRDYEADRNQIMDEIGIKFGFGQALKFLRKKLWYEVIEHKVLPGTPGHPSPRHIFRIGSAPAPAAAIGTYEDLCDYAGINHRFSLTKAGEELNLPQDQVRNYIMKRARESGAVLIHDDADNYVLYSKESIEDSRIWQDCYIPGLGLIVDAEHHHLEMLAENRRAFMDHLITEGPKSPGEMVSEFGWTYPAVTKMKSRLNAYFKHRGYPLRIRRETERLENKPKSIKYNYVLERV